jgi:hypothetical protein
MARIWIDDTFALGEFFDDAPSAFWFGGGDSADA